MSDNVQFEADQEGMRKAQQSFTSRAVFGQAQVPGMAAWLIRRGIIKNESQAKGILLGIFFMDLVASAIIIYIYIIR